MISDYTLQFNIPIIVCNLSIILARVAESLHRW